MGHGVATTRGDLLAPGGIQQSLPDVPIAKRKPYNEDDEDEERSSDDFYGAASILGKLDGVRRQVDQIQQHTETKG